MVSGDGQIKAMSKAAQQFLDHCFGPGSCRASTLPEDLKTWVRRQLHRLEGFPDAEHTTELVRHGCALSVRLIRDTEAGHLLIVGRTHPNTVDLVCTSSEARSINLTAREIEVLRWVECGMANADIAVLCGVSVRTIHKHLQHIFDKLNVENRMAAVRRVRDHILERGQNRSVVGNAFTTPPL